MSEQIDFQNEAILLKSLIYLYKQQTQEEQVAQTTHESNGCGFNMIDAAFLSSLSEQVLAGRKLSEKQLLSARLRIPKYIKQLQSGAWQAIMLPEAIRQNKAKSPYAGRLEINSKGELQFRPNVYPSKQIKDIGFKMWLNGAWIQTSGSISQEVVSDVIKMFGDVDIAAEVSAALAPKTAVLPDYIQQHEILFPFQKETIEFALAYKHVLIGLAPGLGKTACGIFAAQAAGCKHILVLSPLSLLYNWRNEIKKWVGLDANIVYKNNLVLDAVWTITNYDTLRIHPEHFQKKWDCIIVDETILIKNRHTARTKAVKRLVMDTKPEYVFELSGAPISKLYDDLWAQLNILAAKRFSSYWRFTERYCYVEANQWSSYNIIANRPSAADSIKKDLSDIYFSRTQDQVLTLPDWIFDDVHIPMSKEQDKMYGQMEEQFIADLGGENQLMAPNQLAQMIRLVQLASNPVLVGGKDESPKWDAVLDLLTFEQLPCIVWTNFIATLDALMEKLHAKGYKVAGLSGATKPSTRQSIVDAFQNGNLDVLIAHPAVGKFGLTLTAARTAIYLERSYNADDYYQSLHRVRRIGTTMSPHIIHMLSDRLKEGNTADYVIGQVLAARRENQKRITTGEIRKLFMEAR